MSLLTEFREFAMKGNAVDMAVGILVGAAFTEVVNSFVKNIIMPPLSLLTGGDSLTSRYLVLSDGSYSSLTEALDADAIVVQYGTFLNQLIDFLVVAFVVFLVVRQMNKIRS